MFFHGLLTSFASEFAPQGLSRNLMDFHVFLAARELLVLPRFGGALLTLFGPLAPEPEMSSKKLFKAQKLS